MVTIVINSKSLKAYLKYLQTKCSYVYFGDKDSAIEKILKEVSCDEIEINNYSEQFKEEFFKYYIEIIGKTGAELNSIYWWASFTASKNRFISKLLPSLWAYYVICKEVKENPSANILLISPPQQIIPALKQYCRENSIEFKKYDYFFSDFYLSVRQNIIHFLKIVYFIFKNWYRIFFVRLQFKKRFGKISLKKERYYVLRTWVYPSSIGNGNKYSDSFFGRLPDFLINKKKEVMILAGIINNYYDTVKNLAIVNDYLIIPQEFFLRYSDIVRSAFEVLFNRIKIKNRIEFFNLDDSNIIQQELDKDWRDSVRVELLQKHIIKNMTDHFNINTFACTYESNPWERVCFFYLKKYSPSTKIIGYQHAVVTRASANMFPVKEELSVMPMPDKIVTVGEVTKKIMENYGSYPENIIMPACALRHEYIYRLKKKDFIKNNTILVILEGVPECYKLANFVFNALKDSTYHIIIRTHPGRSFDMIKDGLCFDINNNKNFSLSKSPLVKDDLMLTDVVIYWGSTVSLEALMIGIPVIHVNLNDFISVDPLFDCTFLKWTVKKETELLSVVSEIYNMSKEDYIAAYDKAKHYIERYFYRVNDENLSKFLC